jgi:hypothetical protein
MKEMVGERGFEPPTPWSRTQGTQWERMRQSESKLHEHSGKFPFTVIVRGLKKDLVAWGCMGKDGRVTTQRTTHAILDGCRGFTFGQGVGCFLVIGPRSVMGK